MQVQCVHCGKRYSLRDENAGSQFACRSCGRISPIRPADGEETPSGIRTPSETALIATQCTNCGKEYKLRQAAAGMQFKCKQCGAFSPVAAVPAPPPTSLRPDQPLAGLPIGSAIRQNALSPAAAKPVETSGTAASQSEQLMAIPLEPLMALPIQSGAQAASNTFDLLNEGHGTAHASPFAVRLPPARPTPPPPGAPNRKKKRKSRAEREAKAETMSRVFGGLVCMLIGVGVAALGTYGTQNGVWRAYRTTLAGVGIIVLGFLVAIGRYNAD